MSHRLVLQNTLFQILGKGVMVFCALFVVKLLTGIGPGFYGDYVTTYEFLAFFGIIADAGLFAIAVKDMSGMAPFSEKLTVNGAKKAVGSRQNEEYILGNILGMRLLLILLVCGVAIGIAQLVPNYDPRVKAGIILTAFSMGLTIVAGTLSSVLQARMKIQYFSMSLALSKIILAVSIFTLVTHAGSTPENTLFFHLLYAGLFSNILFMIFVAFWASREVPIRLYYDKDYWAQTLKISLPYGLALILQTLYLRLDIILISLLLTKEHTGIYGVCARIMESFLVIGVFFGQAMLPRLANRQEIGVRSQESGVRVRKTLIWGVDKILLVALPIVWGTFLFADEVIMLLANQAFLSSGTQIGSDTLLQILVPTVLFAYLNQLFTFTLVSQNRQNYLLIVNLIAVGFNAGLNYLLIPHYGLQAAAWTTVMSEILVLSCLYPSIKKHFQHVLGSRIQGEIVLTNLVLFALFSLTPMNDHFVPSLVLAPVMYGGVVWWRRKVWL